MLLERLYDDDLAQASYLIGCQASGEAIVVDPRRDVNAALNLAARHGLRIVAVTETHIHADFLSGTRELAARTGARMYVSGVGGPEWSYGAAFANAERLIHGTRIELGRVTVEALHTPGHTPEHLSFLVTDGARADEPAFLLSGDLVFVGDVGRPDLLDEVTGTNDSRVPAARQLFASLRDHFLTLPDHVQVLPGHGSGSACGKALGAIAATTVGYERRTAWWSTLVREGDETGFVAQLLDGQPDAHAYFGRMKRQNRVGPGILGELPPLTEFTPDDVRRKLAADTAVPVDTRHHTAVHAGTVPGALNIPGAARAATFGAWVLDPEIEHRPVVLLAIDRTGAEAMRDHLIRVGIDTVAGYLPTLAGVELVAPQVADPAELGGIDRALLLDVRNRTEYAAGHLPGAMQLSGGRLMWHLDALPGPASGPIVSYCQSGVRNSVAASALRRAGYDVIEIDGSYAAWASLPGNEPVR